MYDAEPELEPTENDPSEGVVIVVVDEDIP